MQILERDTAGLITACRLERPWDAAVRAHRGRRPVRLPCLDESAVDRVDALEQLGSRRFDLLVVGGGIVGAGIAEAASAHGLSVALVDKGDFGSATSSASSKLIHGGLRYLRLGDVGLVREAHHERRILMDVVAPHLVRRLPFLFPLYDDGPFRPWVVQTGIVIYSTIARARLNGPIAVERARAHGAAAAGRRTAQVLALRGRVDERRSADAGERRAPQPTRGAVVVNYAEVVALRGREGADVVRRTGGRSPSAPTESSTRPGRGSTGCAGSRIRRRAGRCA